VDFAHGSGGYRRLGYRFYLCSSFGVLATSLLGLCALAALNTGVYVGGHYVVEIPRRHDDLALNSSSVQNLYGRKTLFGGLSKSGRASDICSAVGVLCHASA